MKIIATIVITSLFWIWLGFRVAPAIGNYYDIKWNSASGYVCIGYMPAKAHPELKWSWSTFNFVTMTKCHGEKFELPTNQE